MRIPAVSLVAALAIAVAANATAAPAPAPRGPLVQSIALDVTIDPASADWVNQALKDA